MQDENNKLEGPELETPIRLVTELVEEIEGVPQTTQIVLKVERSHSPMDHEQEIKPLTYYNNSLYYGTPDNYADYSKRNDFKMEFKSENYEMCDVKEEIKPEVGEIVKIKTESRSGRRNNFPTIHLNHYTPNHYDEDGVRLRDRSPVWDRGTFYQERETVIKELKAEVQNSDSLEKLNRGERSLNPERPWVYQESKLRNSNESIPTMSPISPYISISPASIVSEPIDPIESNQSGELITPASIVPAPIASFESNQPIDLITPEDLGINYYNQASPIMDDSSNEGALHIATDQEDSEEEVQENDKDQPEKNFRKANNPPDGRSLMIHGTNKWPVTSQSATVYCQALMPSNMNNEQANVSNNTQNLNKPVKPAEINGNNSSNNGQNGVNSPSGQLVVVCDRETTPVRGPAGAKPSDVLVLGDTEGFYKIKAGETLNSRYSVCFVAGKGAFSNVVRARDNFEHYDDVVIKIIRKHPSMLKMGLKELEVYRKLRIADRYDLCHCLRFKQFFIHRGHLCLVLEPMTMNLAQFISFRRTYIGGLDLKIVVRIVPQLFLALKVLKRSSIVHADIKPENILISQCTTELNIKLGDFGSALTCGQRVQTPYLVSRYYRAPEIIVGSGYGHGIDIWATGCTIFEMATGRKMFRGEGNNHMLKKIMEYGGKLPRKMIQNGVFSGRHFTEKMHFKVIFGEDTIHEKARVIPRIKRTRNLQTEITPPPPVLLNRYQGRKCRQLRDLLERMICVDSDKRAPIEEIIGHRFITY